MKRLYSIYLIVLSLFLILNSCKFEGQAARQKTVVILLNSNDELNNEAILQLYYDVEASKYRSFLFANKDNELILNFTTNNDTINSYHINGDAIKKEIESPRYEDRIKLETYFLKHFSSSQYNDLESVLKTVQFYFSQNGGPDSLAGYDQSFLYVSLNYVETCDKKYEVWLKKMHNVCYENSIIPWYKKEYINEILSHCDCELKDPLVTASL
jgi:hypothetical protein